MAFDYAKMQATSLALLTKFGTGVTLRRSTPGAYDPSTGQQAVTTADLVFKGVVLDFGAGVTQVQGELLRAEDKRLLLEGAAAPSIKDQVLIGSLVYTIVSVLTVDPTAAAPVLYDLHLRR